jgi:hypothetical protein
MTSVYPNTVCGSNSPPLSAQHRHASESAFERQVKPAPRHTLLKEAALAYAAKGIRVFPCRRDKSPYTPNGFKDASRERSRVSAWWHRWPDASIGMPTGQINGLVVADLDERTPEALKVWESLPPTTEVKTGRASGEGRHRYYRVEGDVRSRKLADGLDMKGDGGYVLLPPSMHESGNRYEVVTKGEVADLPEDLTPPPEATRSSGPKASSSGFHDNAGLIHYPGRNNALASIGGRLRAQGDEYDVIEAVLLDVNRQRCRPEPLPEAEVRKIARSVAGYPAGTAARADGRTLAALDVVQRAMWSERWNPKSDRDLVIALIGVGRRHGSTLPSGGVEVPISYRELAVEAAVSLRTVRKGLDRLRASKWIGKGKRGSGNRRGTLILLPRAKVPHTSHSQVSKQPKDPCVVPLRAPRLRHTAVLPVMERGRRIDTIVIRRLGKTCGAVIDILQSHGPRSVREIADILKVKRYRDLGSRIIGRLADRGIVTVDDDDTVALVDEWEAALQTEREVTGEVFQAKYWRKRYREQRRAYQDKRKVKAHRFNMVDFARRLGRFTSDLHRDVPEPRPDVVVALFDYLKRRPRAAKKKASWLAVTLWAEYDLVPKPTVADVQVALYEIKQAERERSRIRATA